MLRPAGSLTVVGTGIKAVAHITLEAALRIETADKVLYLVADPLTERWIRNQNRASESLFDCYVVGRPRVESYAAMVQRIMSNVRQELDVCVALYGHPGVFAAPGHEAIRQARLEGFRAEMLAGVSAEDCLFADLALDPSVRGCQSYEATDFLVHRRTVDISADLILWQIGVVGDLKFHRVQVGLPARLRVLAERLCDLYAPDHQAVLYEAAQLPVAQPRRHRFPLEQLPQTEVSPISTLHVPPKCTRAVDEECYRRLVSELRK